MTNNLNIKLNKLLEVKPKRNLYENVFYFYNSYGKLSNLVSSNCLKEN